MNSEECLMCEAGNESVSLLVVVTSTASCLIILHNTVGNISTLDVMHMPITETNCLTQTYKLHLNYPYLPLNLPIKNILVEFCASRI